jgi:hypothetical protein
MDALRREWKKEIRTFKAPPRDVLRVVPPPIVPMKVEKSEMVNQIVMNKKLQVDTLKLEESIKKAIIPITKKSISYIENIVPVAVTVQPKESIRICKSKNLNGTPCKCKAKFGNFCLKHKP